MKKHIGMIVLAGIVVLLLVGWLASEITQAEEYVLIQRFGKTVRVYDGDTEAGFKWKWPWPVEFVRTYDNRVFAFDDTLDQISTKDAQQLVITVYCAWRIEEPEQFQRTLVTRDAGEARLREMLRGLKKEVFAKYRMEEYVNTDPTRMKLDRIEEGIFDGLAKGAESYGIRIVLVGIRNLGLPEKVTEAVINAMKAERRREIDNYQAQGESQARAIRARAEQARDQILEFARRQAALIRSEGDRYRAQYYRDFSRNPELAIFLRQLDVLKEGLRRHTVMVMDGGLYEPAGWFRRSPATDVLKEAAEEDGGETPDATTEASDDETDGETSQ